MTARPLCSRRSFTWSSFVLTAVLLLLFSSSARCESVLAGVEDTGRHAVQSNQNEKLKASDGKALDPKALDGKTQQDRAGLDSAAASLQSDASQPSGESPKEKTGSELGTEPLEKKITSEAGTESLEKKSNSGLGAESSEKKAVSGLEKEATSGAGKEPVKERTPSQWVVIPRDLYNWFRCAFLSEREYGRPTSNNGIVASTNDGASASSSNLKSQSENKPLENSKDKRTEESKGDPPGNPKDGSAGISKDGPIGSPEGSISQGSQEKLLGKDEKAGTESLHSHGVDSLKGDQQANANQNDSGWEGGNHWAALSSAFGVLYCLVTFLSILFVGFAAGLTIGLFVAYRYWRPSKGMRVREKSFSSLGHSFDSSFFYTTELSADHGEVPSKDINIPVGAKQTRLESESTA